MSFTSVNPAGQYEGFAGTWADNSENQDAVTGYSEETVNGIAFGSGVVQGVNARGCKIPSTSGDTFKGVAAFSFAHAPGQYGDLSATGILPNDGVNCARHGRIRVLVDAGVTSISPFVDRGYLRYAASGGNTVLGAFTNASDAGTLDVTKQVVFTSNVLLAYDGVTKYAFAELDLTVPQG